MYGYNVFGVTAFINFKIKDWVETNVRYALKSILDVNLLVLCRGLETDTGRGCYTLHMSPIYHWADRDRQPITPAGSFKFIRSACLWTLVGGG